MKANEKLKHKILDFLRENAVHRNSIYKRPKLPKEHRDPALNLALRWIWEAYDLECRMAEIESRAGQVGMSANQADELSIAKGWGDPRIKDELENATVILYSVFSSLSMQIENLREERCELKARLHRWHREHMTVLWKLTN